MKLKPNQLVLHTPTGKYLETISHPDDGEIQARSPGDPTTMQTYSIAELSLTTVKCERDNTKWVPHIVEYTSRFTCYIECPTCARRYFAEYAGNGTFLHFQSDRKLTFAKPK